jgi:hypothetical protein
LRTLPEDQKKAIFGENKEIPFIVALQETIATQNHRIISNELRRQFNQTEGLSELMIEDEFHGLHSRVFPVDIAVKDTKSGKIVLFVELDGQRFHYIKGIEGKPMLKRKNELKARLYEFHYPGVPLRRILLDGKSNKEYANEVREIIDLVVYSPPIDSKVGFWSLFEVLVNRSESYLDSLFKILNSL